MGSILDVADIIKKIKSEPATEADKQGVKVHY